MIFWSDKEEGSSLPSYTLQLNRRGFGLGRCAPAPQSRLMGKTRPAAFVGEVALEKSSCSIEEIAFLVPVPVAEVA